MRRILLPATLLLLPFAPVLGQDDLLPPDEVADLVDRYLERAEESFREGNYEEAEARYRKALKRAPKNLEAQMGLAHCLYVVGRYEDTREAVEGVRKQHPDALPPRLLEARVDLRTGEYAKVRRAMKPVFDAADRPDVDQLHAGVLLARAHAAEGQRGDAKDVLDKIVARYKQRYDVLQSAAFNADELRYEPLKAWPLSREMTVIASALRLYVELYPIEYDFIENAMELVGYARKLDESNWDAWTEYVRITRTERSRGIARARKAYEIVTKRNPEVADLYVEVSRSIGIGWNQGEQVNLAETALRVNPRQTDARAILARIHLEDNQYDEARTHIDQALEVNPKHVEALTLRAVHKLLTGDRAGFDAGMAAVLKINPTYGEGYHIAGLVVAGRQRRYRDAIALVRKGIEIDPTNFEAHTSAGIFLANLGRAEEAIKALRRSRELLPYEHPLRENFLEVLKYVTGSMVEQRTEHFVIRYDPAEYDVHHRYLGPVLEASWEDMVKRYGFEPDKPVLVECFKTQNDFSVRTIGLPGIPALGACFGGLITLDAPRAFGRPFNWHGTAVHEFAHVITLQLSAGQVPRWFTEGVSVLEEKPFESGWGRSENYERQVADAYLTETLPRIATFDGMFRSNRVGYAYYVGGLMLELIREKWGEEGIVKALKLWAKDASQASVFREAFGISMGEFDKMFRARVKERVDRYRIVPNYALIYVQLLEQRKKNPKDGLVDTKLGWAHLRRNQMVDAGAALDSARRKGVGDDPLTILLAASLRFRARDAAGTERELKRFFDKGGEDFDARMMMVQVLGVKGDRDSDAVVAHLEQARKNWPMRAGGTASPYSILERIYLARQQPEKALAILEEQASILTNDVPIRLRLSLEYGRVKRIADQVRVLEEALRINTFDRKVHDALLPLYREQADWKKAARSARCRVALRADEDSDEEVAATWLDLAEVLLEAGQVKEARAAFEEAKKLADAESLPRIAEFEKRLGA
ncbi:MAG: tetratricopeptide repeat protein [Planctomycetota bacterium]